MKQQFYTLECEDCEQEFYDGTLQEIKAYLKNNHYDEPNQELADEGILQFLCVDCGEEKNNKYYDGRIK